MGSKCVTAVSCTCPSKNFRGFNVVITMDQCNQPSLGGLSSSSGPQATVWFARPHCDALMTGMTEKVEPADFHNILAGSALLFVVVAWIINNVMFGSLPVSR